MIHKTHSVIDILDLENRINKEKIAVLRNLLNTKCVDVNNLEDSHGLILKFNKVNGIEHYILEELKKSSDAGFGKFKWMIVYWCFGGFAGEWWIDHAVNVDGDIASVEFDKDTNSLVLKITTFKDCDVSAHIKCLIYSRYLSCMEKDI